LCEDLVGPTKAQNINTKVIESLKQKWSYLFALKSELT
jgi:hypothetical protein